MKRGVRISGGRLRGRTLSVAAGVRPSSARLREALFDVWRERVSGGRILDLFAGSGSVGLEALSRGAREAVLVDLERSVLQHLRRNCRHAAESARVIRLDLPAGLRRLAEDGIGAFELIFADPPYRFTRFAELLAGLEPLLEATGEAAVEHPRRVEPPEAESELIRVACRRYGDSRLSFYQHRSCA
ncbi:MAG: 16S rRNA (guanine(966)-N(2))-methyltransferase RsmD [Thermoanaerobaculia bacterium]